MEKRLIIMLMAATVAVTGAKAQSDDFGMWYEVNIEKKLTNRLDIDLSLENRSRDNHQETDRWSAGVGVSYKLTDWLKASAGYSFLYDNVYKVNNSGKKNADYWGIRHRFNVSLTASKSFGNLSVSLRERWQYTYRPERTVDRYWTYTDEDDDRYEGEKADEHTYSGKANNKWRNRLQLKYKLSKMVRPYVAGETYVAGSGMDKLRLSLGTEFRITKKHSLDVRYLFQKAYDDDDEEGNKHVIGFGYTYKF
jgi:hypothetical protein